MSIIDHSRVCQIATVLLVLGILSCTSPAQDQIGRIPRVGVEQDGFEIYSEVTKVSLPVLFSVTGCVKDGVFTSGKFNFTVELYTDGRARAASLTLYEGKTIRIDGMLSPGDRLSASRFLIVDESCRPDLHGSKFNSVWKIIDATSDPWLGSKRAINIVRGFQNLMFEVPSGGLGIVSDLALGKH